MIKRLTTLLLVPSLITEPVLAARFASGLAAGRSSGANGAFSEQAFAARVSTIFGDLTRGPRRRLAQMGIARLPAALWQPRAGRQMRGGGQKPFGSALTDEKIHEMLRKARSVRTDPKDVGRWLVSLKPKTQSRSPAFKKAFPLFAREFALVRSIPFYGDFGEMVSALAAHFKMNAGAVRQALPFDEITFQRLMDLPVDPTTGARIRAGAFVESRKLVVYLGSEDAVGAFHELYQEVVLALRRDITVKDRHTAATLAETAFIDEDAGLVTPRDEAQLTAMLQYKKGNPLERLFDEFPSVKDEIERAKFWQAKNLRAYTLEKAEALHDKIRAQREVRHEQELGGVIEAAEGKHHERVLRQIVMQIRAALLEEGFYVRILIEMIARGNAEFMEKPDLGEGELRVSEMLAFFACIKDDEKARVIIQQFQSSGNPALTQEIGRLLKSRGPEESFLELLINLAEIFLRRRIVEANHADDRNRLLGATQVTLIAVELIGLIEEGRQRLPAADQKDLEEMWDEVALNNSKSELYYLMKDLDDQTPMSKALDNLYWGLAYKYVRSLASLNAWMEKEGYDDVRAMIVEKLDPERLDEQAAVLLKSKDSQAVRDLPVGPAWPPGHGNLWRRAFLIDQGNSDLIRGYLEKPQGLNFLTSRASIVAILLSARMTRPAAQAFMTAFNPRSPHHKVFDRDDRQAAFFWYYLLPVYNKLLHAHKLMPEKAATCLVRWAGRLNDPRLWVSRDGRLNFNLADWLDEDMPSLKRNIREPVVERIANILAQDIAGRRRGFSDGPGAMSADQPFDVDRDPFVGTRRDLKRASAPPESLVSRLSGIAANLASLRWDGKSVNLGGLRPARGRELVSEQELELVKVMGLWGWVRAGLDPDAAREIVAIRDQLKSPEDFARLIFDTNRYRAILRVISSNPFLEELAAEAEWTDKIAVQRLTRLRGRRVRILEAWLRKAWTIAEYHPRMNLQLAAQRIEDVLSKGRIGSVIDLLGARGVPLDGLVLLIEWLQPPDEETFESNSPHELLSIDWKTVSSDSTREVLQKGLAGLADRLTVVRPDLPPVSVLQLVAWLTRQSLLDLGAGRSREVVRWLRERGAKDVWGLDPNFAEEDVKNDPLLVPLRMQDRWPFETGRFRILTSFFALGDDVTRCLAGYARHWNPDIAADYRSIISEMVRVTIDSSLIILALGPGFQNLNLETELKSQGLRVERELVDGFWLVTRELLDKVLGKIADEIHRPLGPDRLGRGV